MNFVISFHIHLGWWKSAYINLMACTGASWNTIFRRCLPDISYKRHICCDLEITSLALFIFTQLWIKTDKDNYMIVSERHLRLHYASHSDINIVLSALHSKRMSSYVEPWLDFLHHLFLDNSMVDDGIATISWPVKLKRKMCTWVRLRIIQTATGYQEASEALKSAPWWNAHIIVFGSTILPGSHDCSDIYTVSIQ